MFQVKKESEKAEKKKEKTDKKKQDSEENFYAGFNEAAIKMEEVINIQRERDYYFKNISILNI